MITLIIVALALLLGYGLTVGCSMVTTFGLTSASPQFAVRGYLVRPIYKRVQALIWLGSVTAGAGVTCLVAEGAYPWATPTVLAAMLIAMLWMNTWEARQRGMAHQILITILTIAGVAAGYGIAERFVRTWL